ncbi:MAG: hypothetical protein RBR78_05100 [Flavobacteriaceae bacterium]|jgi:hypothetical protein|nr:hypothetical protein [Flavobacteriaceae bacterium]
MTFKELKEKAKGLKTSIDEDTAVLKYKLFLPVFKNLYEEKERCYLIKAENIKISPEYFEATAVIIENLYTLYNLPDFNKNWRFGFNWGFASITSDNSFYFPYGSYRVWTEKETIQHVEKLITENRKDKICDFLHQNKNT